MLTRSSIPTSGAVLALLASLASAQTTNWQQLTTAGPGPRNNMGMVYDSARGRIVMFGGHGPNGGPVGERGDTWEWDGSTWTSVVPQLPRIGHTMAFDRSRNRTVVYGGADYTGPVSSVAVEWDGTAWHWSTAMGPGQRHLAAMCYDATRQKVVLFGGVGLTAMADTWTYDGTAWQQLAITGPSARAYHTLAFDQVRGVVVLFGGFGGGSALGDTWELSASGWSAVVPPVSPPARHGHAMTFDTRRGRVVVVGGESGSGALGDTWEFDGSTWTPVQTPTAIAPRSCFGLAFDEIRGEAIAYGGSPNSGFGDGATWSLHTVASYAQAGTGCSGAVAAPQLTTGQGPRIGSTFAVTIAPLPDAPWFPVLLFGVNDPQLPLCMFSRCDCTLNASLDFVYVLFPSGGQAVWTLPIPLQTTLIGVPFRNQVGVFDIAAGLRLEATSGAGVGVIGTR